MFGAVLVISTMSAAWLWVHDPIARISAEFLLAIANLIAIYLIYRPPRGLLVGSFNQWLLLLAGFFVITIVFLRVEPVWWNSAVLFIQGRQEEASTLLNSQPNANLPLFIGLWGMYASVVGLIRLAVKRLIG